jgi:hypothetical protein
MRSPLAVLTVVLIFATAGTATALGGSSLVSTGDDGAATARGAQQPLGTLSATPRPDTTGGGDETNRAGEFQSSAPADAPGAGTTSPSNVAPTSSSKLPFTGLLAIPVLLAGVGLLVTGMLVRRRAATPATSS